MDDSISIYNFLTKQETVIKFDNPGGRDNGIVRTFLRGIQFGNNGNGVSSATAAVRSHLMAFAAEDSRLNGGQSIQIDNYYNSLLEQSNRQQHS